MTAAPAPAGQRVAGCPLCEGPGGRLVHQGARWRVIHAQEPGFPGFYRVVWTDHVAEYSQLDASDRSACMDAVAEVERALLRHLAPAKVNLAALGNMVPHLHWHVVARFDWDSRFPAPLWAPAVREPAAAALSAVEARLPALEAELGVALAGLENRTAA
ncbi:HIT family protein [Ramlibacter sp.]|uniref:HIT family protein n=1 Tax=Ramlibacter sp. TaxID=1917967 RepID=UPI0035B1F13D